MESRSKSFDTFEEAFADIKKRRSWHRLHIRNVHPDYKDYQPDYREKVMTTIKWVVDNGYKPAFLSEVLFG